MKLSQSTAANEIAKLLRQRFAFDCVTRRWFAWNLVEGEWLPIELSSIHSKIGYWLDHLLPSGYSIGFLRGVEALLRLQLQARFERGWSEESERIWICLVEATK